MQTSIDFPPDSAPAARRQAAPRLCAWLLLLALLCLAQAAQAGTTYRFNGARIDNCDRDGKIYTCTRLPLSNWDDRMVIEDGYTVNVTSDVAFGYNHGLAMSGSARLTSTGNLNIGDIAPDGTQITGGSLHAGGKFTVGNQSQTITADITAGSMQLGSGSRLAITGTIVSTGPVTIASNAVINGPVTGVGITTNSPVTLNGAIDAKGGTFTLASGSTVVGDVSARVVELLAASSLVKGKVTATQSVSLGSSVTVEGNVSTGTLTLQSSEAIVKGTALVDRANLYWHGRVTGNIQCRAGNTVNDCSCVNNQSGYDYNTPMGPKCGPTEPQSATPIDHFLVEHDASAGTCTAARVKVTACANAGCTTRYTGGASVTLQPGGKTFAIGSAGYTDSAEVSSIAAGRQKISLTSTSATSAPAVCSNRSGGSASCEMDFTGGVNFRVTVPHHKAGNLVDALVQAVKANDSNSACVPAFADVVKNVDFTCSRVLPGTGSAGLTLGAQQLTCDGTAKQTVAASFDAEGTAKLGLGYPDVGKLALNASAGEIKGGTTFVVAPDHFVISAPRPLRAGADFDLTVQAMNANRTATPSFDTSLLGTDSTPVRIELDCVAVGAGDLSAKAAPFSNGSARFRSRFSDVGNIDVTASLTDFLGSKTSTVWSTRGNASACSAAIGPFVPMYYEVAIEDAARVQTENGYFYSDEPISLKVSAMNAQGVVTANYPAAYGAGDTFTLSALDNEGTPLEASLGQLSGTLQVADFAAGVASWKNARTRQPRYRFAVAQTPGTVLRLRVENKNTQAGYHVTSAWVPADKNLVPERARPEIRSGRLRIASRFGRAGTELTLPVTAEYWTGQSWMRNYDDDFTLVPATSLAVGDANGRSPTSVKPAPGPLSKGETRLALKHDGAGWFDVVINLGDGVPQSCSKAGLAPAGAGMPWLRSRSGCIDPSGRATFGIPSPEQRRLIHVREAYR